MAHPAGQILQDIVDSDAKPADAGLTTALSRFQGNDLGVVHGLMIAGLEGTLMSEGRRKSHPGPGEIAESRKSAEG